MSTWACKQSALQASRMDTDMTLDDMVCRKLPQAPPASSMSKTLHPPDARHPSFGKSNESMPWAVLQQVSPADISRWTLQVQQHYQVPTCFVALSAADGLHLKGRHGIEQHFLREPSMCRHEGLRELPVIVSDTMDVAMYRYDQLVTGPPSARFFAAAPLMLPGTSCIGTLCIMDPTPRRSFLLLECACLIERAEQITSYLHLEVQRFLSLTSESLASLRSPIKSLGREGGSPRGEGISRESIYSGSSHAGTLESMTAYSQLTKESLLDLGMVQTRTMDSLASKDAIEVDDADSENEAVTRCSVIAEAAPSVLAD